LLCCFSASAIITCIKLIQFFPCPYTSIVLASRYSLFLCTIRPTVLESPCGLFPPTSIVHVFSTWLFRTPDNCCHSSSCVATSALVSVTGCQGIITYLHTPQQRGLGQLQSAHVQT
jgi:hypothetical protein